MKKKEEKDVCTWKAMKVVGTAQIMRNAMKKKKTEVYMRETTKGLKVISKTTNNYCMVMVLSPKQWNALVNAKKPIVVLRGGDLMDDAEMELEELDEKERITLDGVKERCDFIGD